MNNLELCKQLGIKKDSLKKKVRRLRPFLKEKKHFTYEQQLTNGGIQTLRIWTQQGIELIKNKSIRSNVYEKEFYIILNKVFDGIYKIIPQYKIGKYRVDFFIPRLNLVIEYYEKNHKHVKKTIKIDKEREEYIKKRYALIVVEMGKELESVNKILKQTIRGFMTFVRDVLPSKREKLSTEARKKALDKVEAARKEDAVVVKGIFKNLESPGGDLEFAYRGYRGEPIRIYRMIDGDSYTIPLGVAKHINRQCKYHRSAHLIDKDGQPMIGAGKPVERYQFISTEFS